MGYEIACVEGGSAMLLHRGGVHELAPTHLVVIPPGEVHAVAETADAAAIAQIGLRRLMWVSREYLHRSAHAVAVAAPHLPTTVVADAVLAERFRALHDLLLRAPSATGGYASTERIDTHVVAFLRKLVAVTADAPPSIHQVVRQGSQVARARAYLHAHWAEPVSLDVLARVACYSKHHLVNAFRRAYGLPPRAYQTRLRLAHAQELLARGESITGVAYTTRFADQAHLTRAFKHAFGITPGGWARAGMAPAPRAAAA